MSQESYEKWYPVETVPECLSGVSLITLGDGTLLVICHSGEDYKADDILLKFESIFAYQVHDGFAHPWMDHSSSHPTSEGSSYTFPFLKVNGSIWLSSFSEVRLIGLLNKRLHLQIITQTYCIDILCDDYPQVNVFSQQAVEQLFDALTIIETLSLDEGKV